MNSRTLAAIVLKGTTTTRNGPRNGPGTCRSYNIQPRNELVRNVFPKPYQQGLQFLLLDHEKASLFKAG
jgi:hypothetical protein